jgi:hypothetical protein
LEPVIPRGILLPEGAIHLSRFGDRYWTFAVQPVPGASAEKAGIDNAIHERGGLGAERA